jgi:uncharacterized phage protein gp47/JayE
MMSALRASEPDLDTSIGTPLRKILDAVSESIAEAYVDQHLITYAYDIDSKVEGDLDDFVSLFGFARIPAQRAQGVVTFTRPQDRIASQTSVVIPPGTQLAALTNPMVYVQTIVSALLTPGQYSVDIPVQSLTPGPQGNVASGLISQVVSQNSMITGVTNSDAMSGGTPQESDEELRARFKATVFRSLAGTQAMYDGVVREIPQDPALPEVKAIRKVNVLGSSKRWREQIQMVNGVAVSTIAGAAYIFADNVFCGPNIDAGSMLTQGVNFSFAPNNPTNRSNASATLASLSNAVMPDGLYDLDFEYVPQASRNDPGNTRFGQGGVNNRIDVWVDGIVPENAAQSVVFSDVQKFNDIPGTPLYRGYYRQDTVGGTSPDAGSIFVPLAFGPVLGVSDSLTIAGTTYQEGVDYFIAQRADCFGYAATSICGLAWKATALPPSGSIFTINYNYNKIAALGQDAIAQWRLVGTDAQVHAGRVARLKFNLAVVYDRRYEASAVNTSIDQAIASFLLTLGFEAALQVSDVLQVVHNVPGVDNVRFLTATDNAVQYAIQRMSSYGTDTVLSTYSYNGRAADVQFSDDTYPVFYATSITVKASNTFGQV